MAALDVAIIDGGGANLASLGFALSRLGARSTVTTDAAHILAATHVILPGVGAAAPAMERLRRHGLESVIERVTRPFLGICLGMQLLAEHSAEDDTRCLGILPGRVTRLAAGPDAPVPNMGWCRLCQRATSRLFDGVPEGDWFYFVHSFALPPGAVTLGTAVHRAEFSAVVGRGNFFGTQFHPERSAKAGARILANFLAMDDAPDTGH